MPGSVTVYCIGSNHTQAEHADYLLAYLNKMTTTQCVAVDGPGGKARGLMGVMDGAIGKGMDKDRDEAVNFILNQCMNYDTINLVGHSRGAITATRVMNEFHKRAPHLNVQFNVLLFDPVHMSSGHSGQGARIDQGVGLNRMFTVVHENVNTWKFPITLAMPVDPSDANRLFLLNLPGKHGSCMQFTTCALGRLGHALAVSFLVSCGTKFASIVQPTWHEIVDIYADVTLENSVTVNKDGKLARTILRGSGEKSTVKNSPQRAAVIQQGMNAYTGRLESSDAKGYTDHHYFLNQHHAFAFKQAYPNFFNLFCNITPSASAIKAELDLIMDAHVKTWDSLFANALGRLSTAYQLAFGKPMG